MTKNCRRHSLYAKYEKRRSSQNQITDRLAAERWNSQSKQITGSKQKEESDNVENLKCYKPGHAPPTLERSDKGGRQSENMKYRKHTHIYWSTAVVKTPEQS